jgi:hypothetical protein
MYPGALAADVATLRDDVVGIDGNLTTAAMAKALEELRARDDVAWTCWQKVLQTTGEQCCWCAAYTTTRASTSTMASCGRPGKSSRHGPGRGGEAGLEASRAGGKVCG